MENDDFERLLCNNPQHAVYKVDEVVYSDPKTGIRAILGRRERPISDAPHVTGPIPLDHYLVIEKPLSVTHSVLVSAFKTINELAKTEKRLPGRYRDLLEEQLKVIDEMSQDTLSAMSIGMSREASEKQISGLRKRFYEINTELENMRNQSPSITTEGWSKRGPKIDSHLKRRNAWILRRVHTLHKEGLNYRNSCWQTSGEAKSKFGGKRLSVNYIATIAKVTIGSLEPN